MTRRPQTELVIDAPAQAIWDVLIDTRRWSEWNPVLLDLVGPLRVGARLRLQLALGPRSVPIPVRLTRWEPGRELAWKGGVRGIVTAHHGFRLEPVSATATRFVHYEQFDGIVIAVVGAALERRLMPRYAAMNRALEAEVLRVAGA